MKRCTKCNEIKPLEQYHNHKGHSDGKASSCKDCHRTQVRIASAKYAKNNTTAYKASQVRHKLKRTYGITPCQFTRQLIEQRGRCCICNHDDPGGKGQWHIDHDHATGTLRGLLCHNCNLLLGHAKDSRTTLTNAISYLTAGGVWRAGVSRR